MSVLISWLPDAGLDVSLDGAVMKPLFSNEVCVHSSCGIAYVVKETTSFGNSSGWDSSMCLDTGMGVEKFCGAGFVSEVALHRSKCWNRARREQ